jgi:hypothetical protein
VTDQSSAALLAGRLAVAFAVALGVALRGALGVTLRGALGVALRSALGVALRGALAITLRVALAITLRVALAITLRVALGIAFGLGKRIGRTDAEGGAEGGDGRDELERLAAAQSGLLGDRPFVVRHQGSFVEEVF